MYAFPTYPDACPTGRTVEEAGQNIRDAIAFHLEGIREDGQVIPEPTTHVAEFEIA